MNHEMHTNFSYQFAVTFFFKLLTVLPTNASLRLFPGFPPVGGDDRSCGKLPL